MNSLDPSLLSVEEPEQCMARKPSLSIREIRDCDWAHSDAWERSNSNYFDLLSEEPEERSRLIHRALEALHSDPVSAFQLHVEAAEAGSVFAMENVGWHYWTGTGVASEKNSALEYYHRAVVGGSWMATIGCARLFADLGHWDECETILRDGVALNFAPAYFWLAWLRYQRFKTPQMREEIRPLLEHATRLGHPAAKFFLSGWMVRGKFGLKEIPRGWLWGLQEAADFASRRT